VLELQEVRDLLPLGLQFLVEFRELVFSVISKVQAAGIQALPLGALIGLLGGVSFSHDEAWRGLGHIRVRVDRIRCPVSESVAVPGVSTSDPPGVGIMVPRVVMVVANGAVASRLPVGLDIGSIPATVTRDVDLGFSNDSEEHQCKKRKDQGSHDDLRFYPALLLL
jgi:hypothetical protein